MSDLKTKTSELESGTKIIRNKMPLTKHHEIGVHCLIMNKILVVIRLHAHNSFSPMASSLYPQQKLLIIKKI